VDSYVTESLTRIRARIRSYGTTDHIAGTVAWHYCEDVRWLVAELHAAREELDEACQQLVREHATEAQLEADLAAAQTVIKAARDWTAEGHSGTTRTGHIIVCDCLLCTALAAYDNRKEHA
jgi:hypothetical protein